WLTIQIEEQEEEAFRQATRGRPSGQTNYVNEKRSRYTLRWMLNLEALSEAEREDGVFPLLMNDRKLTSTEVIQAYKRQPLIEKRFSQFKTDFAVAPVYLLCGASHNKYCVAQAVMWIPLFFSRYP